MVYLNVTLYYHFIVVLVDVDKFVDLRSFQGVYNFIEWNKSRGKDIYRKNKFLESLGKLFGLSETEKQQAAFDLFSYNLADLKTAHQERLASKASSAHTIVEKLRNLSL